MKYKKIVLAGGNGYLGGVLAQYYRYLADEIIILSRKARLPDGNIVTHVWDGHTEGEWVKDLAGADMLINLCGKNVNCRYTSKNRAEIISSRVIPTTLLGNVIGRLEDPPKLWINISGATIYRPAEDHPQDEETGETGHGFTTDVCKRWEEAFFNSNTSNTRKVALRMGVVLGRTDGGFPRLLNLVKFGLGGRQGNGQQYISWVHEQDVAKCTEWILQHGELTGTINCTAPQPIKNADLMRIIRNSYGMPLGLPSPAWLLELGAVIIRTEAELILKSNWVIPQRLLDSGYSFLFPSAEYAVNDILSTKV